MAAELYNDWWVSPEWSDVGPSYGSYSDRQKYNALKVYTVFHALGWTDNAIAGMVGNMQIESGIDPACSYPKIGTTMAGINNTVASQYPDRAYGLVQWKGRGSTDPDNNQLVGYAIRYGYQWYDGQIQMNRLTWEYQSGSKFHAQTVDGVYYTFNSYAASTSSPSVLAKAWLMCYEGTYSWLPERQSNAEYWYTYFQSGPTPPTPPTPTTDWVSGSYFSSLAVAYDPDITGVDIPYSQWDCIAFVNQVWQDIPVVDRNGYSINIGTNTLWRRNMSGYPTQTYSTTSPMGQSPTPVLWWKGTVSQCTAQYGEIPAGTLLFHQISEAGPPPIPSQYEGDGIGNFAHVGIYIGNDQVMQSGGMDSSSVPGGGVHRSAYNPNAWNYAAFVCYVNPLGAAAGLPAWLLSRWSNLRKGDVKRVRKTL